jgi:dolichol-phosphate mannosyltransferase
MKATESVAVVMPVWNEGAGIAEFIIELRDSFEPSQVFFVVVDDASSDNSVAVLKDLENQGFPVRIIQNTTNLGHGPSTHKALSLGVSENPKFVISIDGDGQFLGVDVRRVYELISGGGEVAIVEGVRVRRGDPLYRKIVTIFTRVLVFAKSGQLPRDANTPLRAYTTEALSVLLEIVPNHVLIPNLMFSVISRRKKMQISQLEVTSIPRRGGNEIGSTWGKGIKIFPSKRFITFCVQAFSQWLSFTVRART